VDTVQAMLSSIGSAVLGMAAQPFYYIAVFLIAMHYLRQIRVERQLFAVKLHNWVRLTLTAIGVGMLIGLGLSAAALFLGSAITSAAVLWLWSIAALLMLVRIRYLCFAYSAGIIALLQWLAGFTGLASRGDWLGGLVSSLAAIDAAGLLLLVALLHLAEAHLVFWHGDRLKTPLFLEGKRGKLVGGYMLQGFWPIPLLLLVPVEAGGGTAAGAWDMLPWTPLFAGADSAGWTVIALPMVIGFTELTKTMLPRQKARHTAKGLLVYSLCLAAASVAAWKWPFLLPVAAVLSIVLHEALVWRSSIAERRGTPLFVHDARGLRILGIVPGTPAEAMGLLPGEILQKVNGKKVYSKAELYDALALNPAFCKLEVLNESGELKFAQRARYAGEHHQLGVILAPDEAANFYAGGLSVSIVGWLKGRKASNRRQA
jgi:hypothetical protein